MQKFGSVQTDPGKKYSPLHLSIVGEVYTTSIIAQ